jgi:hypothetical protein
MGITSRSKAFSFFFVFAELLKLSGPILRFLDGPCENSHQIHPENEDGYLPERLAQTVYRFV